MSAAPLLFVFKVLKPCPLVLLIRKLLRRRWLWSIGGMMTGETGPSATLCSTNLLCTGLVSNRSLHGETPATGRAVDLWQSLFHMSLQPAACSPQPAARNPQPASDEKWQPFNCFFSRVGLRTYQHLCRYCTYCYFRTCHPQTSPTVTGVTLRRETVGHPFSK